MEMGMCLDAIVNTMGILISIRRIIDCLDYVYRRKMIALKLFLRAMRTVRKFGICTRKGGGIEKGRA